jgi:hypothetical protein
MAPISRYRRTFRIVIRPTVDGLIGRCPASARLGMTPSLEIC